MRPLSRHQHEIQERHPQRSRTGHPAVTAGNDNGVAKTNDRIVRVGHALGLQNDSKRSQEGNKGVG